MSAKDKIVYRERFIENTTGKTVRACIITPPPIFEGQIKMLIKGRQTIYCYPSYDEFIKDWSIPPFDEVID